MIAHQHKMNAKVIAAMVDRSRCGQGARRSRAPPPATRWPPSNCSPTASATKYRLSLTATMEVVVPFWVKGAIRADLANRMGVSSPA